MPRYRFIIYDGRSNLGVELDGMDPPNAQAAKMMALGYVGDIIRDEGMRAAGMEDWHIEVTDGTGLVLLRMNFCSPAAGSSEGFSE